LPCYAGTIQPRIDQISGEQKLRQLLVGSAVFSVLLGSPAFAGDLPQTGSVPDWVNIAPDISVKDLPKSGNVLPQFDEQVLIEGDTITAYFDVATYISSAEILNKVGTVSASWQPAHGNLTFHRIDILRGDQWIDVLKGGAGITVLRREAGLEKMVVDGRLTAVKHIEDLRVGDVLRTSFSLSGRDDVLDGNVQDALILLPSPLRIGFGRARLVWPAARQINWKTLMPGVVVSPQPIKGNRNELVIMLPVGKLPEMPKNLPARFEPLPVIPFSTFKSWGEVSAVMAPLYRHAGAIAPGSDLAKAVDAIAARSPDPLERMADALQLVQNDVRYVLNAMGTGNYVPQAPKDTWVKRYGDCKAKTLLLLAILDRLGIAAEPVLANIKRGDAVGEMPPSAMAFDHVFVRAEIGKDSYWLDGTMLGSRLADIKDVPRYGFVLPLFAKDAALFKLPERANARPGADIDLVYDMTAGPHLPVPYSLKVRYAGRMAEELKVGQGGDYDERLQKFAEGVAKNWTGSTEIGQPHAEYDLAQAVWTLSVEGVGYPDWQFREGRYEMAVEPLLKVGLDAERGRAAWQKIPALIDRPWTAHSRMTIRLPNAGMDLKVEGSEPASLTFPAVNWNRVVTQSGGELVQEIDTRESGREIPAEEISATSKAISDTMGRNTRIILPSSYPQRWDDVSRMRSSGPVARVRAIFDQRVIEKPDDAGRLADRAWLATRLFDWNAAEADYSKAVALDESAQRYIDRGDNRSTMGDHEGALKDAQAAFDLEPGNEGARDRLASELAEAGKVDEAIELLKPDPDLTTDDGLEDFLHRITVLELGSRHTDALTLLDGALAKQPSSAELRNTRCWYKALRRTDLDGALADCNHAIQHSSDPATFLDSRAMVHYRSGRLKESRMDLESALAVSPEQSSSRFMLGIVLTRLGMAAQGAAEISAARKIFPGVDHFFQHFDISP
jgi:tetratricopeptide (TPR) repeat protein